MSNASLERDIHSGDRARQIAALRFMLAEWGIDTSDLSDEELEEAIQRFGEIVRQSGLTAAEATDAFASLARAAGRDSS